MLCVLPVSYDSPSVLCLSPLILFCFPQSVTCRQPSVFPHLPFPRKTPPYNPCSRLSMKISHCPFIIYDHKIFLPKPVCEVLSQKRQKLILRADPGKQYLTSLPANLRKPYKASVFLIFIAYRPIQLIYSAYLHKTMHIQNARSIPEALF